MKLFFKIIISVFIIFALVIGGGAFYITRGLDAGTRLEIGNADLASLKDGDYRGQYRSGRWTNEVSVSVQDHKITGIEIIKDVTFPKPEWAKQLFQEVMDRQDLDVDVVAGATVTSKAYLKSIENALDRQAGK